MILSIILRLFTPARLLTPAFLLIILDLFVPFYDLLAQQESTAVDDCSSAISVQPNENRLLVGMAGGVLISRFYGARVTDEFAMRTSFFVSGLVHCYVTQHLGIHCAGSYTRRGAELTSEFDSRVFRLDYIEFAPMLLAHLPLHDRIKAYVSVGPVLAWNVSALVDIRHGDINETLQLTDIRAFNPGVAVEIGTVVNTGVIHWLVGIGYTLFPYSIQDSPSHSLALGNKDFRAHIGIML